MPLKMVLKKTNAGWQEEEEEIGQQKEEKIICWVEEARQLYKEMTDEIGNVEDKELGTIEENWKKLKKSAERLGI
ncbi:hypothetical protein X777_14591 [Ooceraea biroi]|uniref:Uncharacterized protein n=1 Tax=Ooceraea biroi TaxID=2015173 RepID=A0A026WWW2_OOCBI|nr:hypothetical protein X777_14591 [Ooceraea biroi]